MKKIFFNRLTFLTLIFVLMLSACGNVFDQNELQETGIVKDGKALVTFVINEQRARTVFPDVSVDVESYELYGSRTGGVQELIAAFSPEDYMLALIDTGTWDFTMNALNEDGEVMFKGTVTDKEIYSTLFNTVSFSLYTTDTGTGSISVVINFPSDQDIDKIIVDSEAQGSIEEFGIGYFTDNYDGTYTFFYEKDDVNSGDHVVIFNLYQEDILRAAVLEIVLVRDNLTSSKTINLAGAELKPVYYVNGTVIFDGDEDLDYALITLYSDAYSTVINTISLEEDEGIAAWNWVFSEGINIYMEVVVGYTGKDPMYIRRGPVNVSSTNPADREISAVLTGITGTILYNEDLLDFSMVYVYSDAEENELIDMDVAVVDFSGEFGTWTVKIPQGISEVYLRVTVDYGVDYQFSVRKGPVTVPGATPADWEIDARLIQLNGSVIYEDSPLDFSELEIWSQPDYTGLIHAISNLDDLNSSWTYKIAPIYPVVYLSLNVVNHSNTAFALTRGPIVIATAPASDWIFDTRILERTGNVVIDTRETVIDAFVRVYDEDDNLITTITSADINATGNWSLSLTPNYTTVKLIATVEYENYGAMVKTKTVNTALTSIADWTINCMLPNTGGIIIGGDPSLLMYLNDSTTALANNGTTIIEYANPGTFNVKITTLTYSQIKWFVNGNQVANNVTNITLPRRTVGTFIVTVEATPYGGVSNTGTHTFVVQD